MLLRGHGWQGWHTWAPRLATAWRIVGGRIAPDLLQIGQQPSCAGIARPAALAAHLGQVHFIPLGHKLVVVWSCHMADCILRTTLELSVLRTNEPRQTAGRLHATQSVASEDMQGDPKQLLHEVRLLSCMHGSA